MPNANLKIKIVNALPETLDPSTLYLSPDPTMSSGVILTQSSLDGTSHRGTLSKEDVKSIISEVAASPNAGTLRVTDINGPDQHIELKVDPSTWAPYSFVNEFLPLIKKSDQMEVTEKMTQPVGINANGTLFTFPPGVKTFVQTFDMPNVGDHCNIILDGNIVVQYEKTTNGGYEGYKVTLFSIGGDRTIGFRRDTTYDNTSPEGVNNNNLVLKPSPAYVSDSLSYGSMREFTRKVIVDYATMVSWRVDVFGFGVGKLRFIIERQEDTDPPTPDIPIPTEEPVTLP